MDRTFDVLIERDQEDWLVASVPALPGCHTQGRTLEELLARVHEAIRACLEDGAGEEAIEVVGVLRVRVA